MDEWVGGGIDGWVDRWSLRNCWVEEMSELTFVGAEFSTLRKLAAWKTHASAECVSCGFEPLRLSALRIDLLRVGRDPHLNFNARGKTTIHLTVGLTAQT
jgi:hypothetical protein